MPQRLHPILRGGQTATDENGKTLVPLSVSGDTVIVLVVHKNGKPSHEESVTVREWLEKTGLV